MVFNQNDIYTFLVCQTTNSHRNFCLPISIDCRDAGNLCRGTGEEVDERQGQSDGQDHTHQEGKLLATDLEEVYHYSTGQGSQACRLRNGSLILALWYISTKLKQCSQL